MFFHSKVVYEDKKYGVSVISNSTVSNLQFNETAKMLNFNIEHTNSTVAFCRVMFVKVLVNEPYAVLIDDDQVNATVLPVSNVTHTFLYFTSILSSREVTIVSKPFYELLEKYNALLAGYYALNSTLYELLGDYAVLLANYIQLEDNFNVLNATYYEIVHNYTELQENYDALQSSYNDLIVQYSLLNFTYENLLGQYSDLNMTYNELKGNYTKLQGDYDSLSISYSNLTVLYNSLNSTYYELESQYEITLNDLQNLNATYYEVLGNYTELKLEQEATKSELSNIRNLMYVFVTAALAAVVLLSLGSIRYYRMFQRQKRVIDRYERELRGMTALDVARALFTADVERRRDKIVEFEKKYGVRVQPRSTLEDVIKSLRLKEKVKD